MPKKKMCGSVDVSMVAVCLQQPAITSMEVIVVFNRPLVGCAGQYVGGG